MWRMPGLHEPRPPAGFQLRNSQASHPGHFYIPKRKYVWLVDYLWLGLIFIGTSFLRRPSAVAKLALAFFSQAKLNHLQSFHQDRCCTHYAQTNCNDLHISCSWANASPQTKQTKRVSAREQMPALNPNKQNLYWQGRGCMPNKHPSVHFYSGRSFIFLLRLVMHAFCLEQ